MKYTYILVSIIIILVLIMVIIIKSLRNTKRLNSIYLNTIKEMSTNNYKLKKFMDNVNDSFANLTRYLEIEMEK